MSRKKIITAPTATPAPATSTLAPRGLPIKAAAAYSGITVWGIRELIWSRKLPAIRLGKRDVILRESLDAYLDKMQRGGAM